MATSCLRPGCLIAGRQRDGWSFGYVIDFATRIGPGNGVHDFKSLSRLITIAGSVFTDKRTAVEIPFATYPPLTIQINGASSDVSGDRLLMNKNTGNLPEFGTKRQ